MTISLASRLKHSCFPRLGLSVLLLSLTQVATSLPIDDDTSPLLLPGMLNATRPSCAEIPNFPKWYQPSEKFDSGDCDKAMGIFFNDYVKNHNGARYEFYASQSQPIHGIPTQRVPLKFASGKLYRSKVWVFLGVW